MLEEQFDTFQEAHADSRRRKTAAIVSTMHAACATPELMLKLNALTLRPLPGPATAPLKG
jgi:hypothetical protein